MWYSDQVNRDPNALAVLTAEFCNNVLGKEASKRAERFRLGNKLLTLKNAVEIVLREHYFSAAWMFSSLLRTRVQRFLECFKTLLIALFLDSLIYGIFFPSDGKCETYQTKQTCLVPQAKLGGNQCVWEKEAAIRCAPKEPPGNVITILILALVITILIRPPMILIDLVAKACECRPRFESWSRLWSTNSWIGSLHHPSLYTTTRRKNCKKTMQHRPWHRHLPRISSTTRMHWLLPPMTMLMSNLVRIALFKYTPYYYPC